MTLLHSIAAIGALYHLVVASRLLTWFGVFVPPHQHRAVSLLLALLLIFIPRQQSSRLRTSFGWAVLALGVAGVGYVVVAQDAILNYGQYGYLDPVGVVLALFTAVAVLEAVRRKAGIVLPGVIVFFAGLTVFQPYLPGLLHGKGYALDRLTYSIYVGSGGIFGTPLGVASTVLMTFVVFGRLLEVSGAGRWFIRLTMCLVGWSVGGAAKVAVLASALFGMVSGSPSANIATIGVVTIPLMTRSGYPPRVAAAIEATASTGGQLMPPVMGAVAFIMAETLAIPYGRIAAMAAIPASLFFVVLLMSAHVEAAKRGVPALKREDLPGPVAVFREGWFYLVPFAVLLYLLVWRTFPPEMAGIISAVALVPVSFTAPERDAHLTPSRIWRALGEGVQAWLPIAAVTAAVGILIGSLELSGLGVKFSGFILDLSGGSLAATLVLVGAASFVLGMGLDSIPSYLTLTVLAAPALVQLGVPVEIAHLYVLYWGMSSFITPPTCLAVYVACAISGSNIWETGWEAVRFGIAAYIVPFAFVYHPGLLGRGTAVEVVGTVALALVVAAALTGALRGYLTRLLPPGSRVALGVGSILMVGPVGWMTIAGLLMILGGAVLGAVRRSHVADAVRV